MINKFHRLLLVTTLALLWILFPMPASAGDYTPTPLMKAIAEHPVVLVGKVHKLAGWTVTVLPVSHIKGRKQASYTLPAVWRPGSPQVFGPRRMVVDEHYLLLLRIDKDGRPALSKDFACDGVVRVKSARDPIVRAAVVIHALLGQQDDAAARRKTLAGAWKNESDKTIYRLLQEFCSTQADEAIVPFLVCAMGAGYERSSLMELSAHVIQMHGYRSAIPGVLKALKKNHDWASLYAATTLGKLKAKDAHDPIMKLIRDKEVGNREYFIHALCYLEDRRSVPFLIKTLEDYRVKNIYMHYSWVEPLISAMQISDRKLQTLAVEALGRIEWFRAAKALAKVQELRRTHADDAKFRRLCDTVIRHMNHK